MNDDIDERYRQAAAQDASRPSEETRRAILAYAAAVAAERRPRRPTANRVRWRSALAGTLAAAMLAGLLIVPRIFDPATVRDATAVTSSRSDQPAQSVPSAPAAMKESAPRLSEVRPERSNRAKAAPPPSFAEAPAALPADALRADAAPQSQSALADRIEGVARAAPSRQNDSGAALRRAAEQGDLAQLGALLTAPVSIDARDVRGRTALLLAVMHGRDRSVDALLAGGADPNAADGHGLTPLKAALDGDHHAIAAALRRAGAR